VLQDDESMSVTRNLGYTKINFTNS